MASTARSVVADRIRIEDEVWEQAFSSRVRSRPPRTGRPLRPLEDEAPGPAYESDGPVGAYGLHRPARRNAAESPVWATAPSQLVVELRPRPDHASDPYASQPGTGRRTVRIQGRGAERHLPVSTTRQRSRPAHESAYFRPDKLAMWAVLLGFLLVAAAILSGHS